MKVSILIIAFVFAVFETFAQKKTFVREYSYDASELDSKTSSRVIALEQIRSLLLNELGTYVQSEQLLTTSEIGKKFSQNFAERISIISAGITKLEILDESWDGKTYWVNASITIDLNEYKTSLKRLVEDQTALKQVENLKKSLDQANQELESLRRLALSGVSSSQEVNNSLQMRYSKSVDALSVKELFDDAQKIKVDAMGSFRQSADGREKRMMEYEKANVIFDRILTIKPDFAEALFYRGQTYQLLEKYEAALSDYNRYIQIDNEHYASHNNRAQILIRTGDFDSACADLFKAAELRFVYKEKYRDSTIDDIKQYCEPELISLFGPKDAKNILDLNIHLGLSMDVAKIILGKPHTKRQLNENGDKERWMFEYYDWTGYSKSNVKWKAYDFENGKLVYIR